MQQVSELPRVSHDPPVWKVPNGVTYAERRGTNTVRRRVRRTSKRRTQPKRSTSGDKGDNKDDSDDNVDDDIAGILGLQHRPAQKFPNVRSASRVSDDAGFKNDAAATPNDFKRPSQVPDLKPNHHNNTAAAYTERLTETPKTNPSQLTATDHQERPKSTPHPKQDENHFIRHHNRSRRASAVAKAGSRARSKSVAFLDSQLSNVANDGGGEADRRYSSMLANYAGGDREEFVKSSLTLRLESKAEEADKEREAAQRNKTLPNRPATSGTTAVRSRGRLSLPQAKSCFTLHSPRFLDRNSLTSITSEELRGLVATKDSDDDRESDEFDTDCEPDVNSEFRHADYVRSMTQTDSDIGHVTYQLACEQLRIKPRAKIKNQLKEKRLDLHHGGLLAPEAKAISSALQANARIEEIDLSYNALPGKALAYIADVVADSIYVTKLNLCGNIMDEDGAKPCSNMLAKNSWLTELDLSECAIGDNEILLLSQGMQDNQHIHTLNLSKNKIGLGGLVLGRVLGFNDALKRLDLSWNHIRGGAAVSICNSLKKNTALEELNLAWNGIGFEGSLALGEALRLNRTLRYLNLENNRINWDCAPYLTRALTSNRSLEELVIGQNPISMEGCEDIMMALSKPSSGLKSISFAGIPINMRIALIATDISKTRNFSMDHGGILSTIDVIGMHRSQREDPFSLLIRYLSLMGIRVMDLFRMLDKDNKLCVSRSKFIQGLKRVRVPLNDEDIMKVAKRLQSNKHGQISYTELATTVRNHIREDRLEDRRQKIIQKKKLEERKRILESGKPFVPADVSYLPTLYNMYDRSERPTQSRIFSPSLGTFSRRGYNDEDNMTPLPLIISSERNVMRMAHSSEGGRNSTSASDLPRAGKSYLTQSVTFSGYCSVASDATDSPTSYRKVREDRSPYLSQLKKQQRSISPTLPRQL